LQYPGHAHQIQNLLVNLQPISPSKSTTINVDEARASAYWTIPDEKQRCVLVLHTSGTSGKKKVVPYSLATIAVRTIAMNSVARKGYQTR
jgi:acyl-coenzyme A synthetase/AMP-(fatty) acid ligase